MSPLDIRSGRGFDPLRVHYRKYVYIGRISTVESEPGSQRIATFNESNHVPGCDVGDPAPLCTVPGERNKTRLNLDRVNARGNVQTSFLWLSGGNAGERPAWEDD